MSDVPDNIVNKALYRKIKEEAKEKFDRYPSLYASNWISAQYVSRNGKYKDSKNKTVKDSKKNGTLRWHKERWIQIIPYVKEGKIIECGSNNKDTKACRPLIRVNKGTPPTIDEIIKKFGKRKVITLANKKNKDMKGRLNWINGTFTPSDERPINRKTQRVK